MAYKPFFLVGVLKPFRSSLHSDFLRFFHIAIARTDAQRDVVARLRHRVYSEELGFEPRAASGREHDQYDSHSLHCLVTHRSSGRPAACVRIICPDKERQLALEDHCLESVHLGYLEKLALDRDSVCEVSRLTVDPAFRRGAAIEAHFQEGLQFTQISKQERRCFSLVWLGTTLSAIAAAELVGRNQLYAMMEASLPRLLHQAGVHAHRAGDFTEYHGSRAAFFILANEVAADLRSGVRPLYEDIKSELSEPRCASPQAAAS